MFSKTTTTNCISKYSKQIEKLAKKIQDADAILLGAGAGLSTSDGFTYSGERFIENFSDFIAVYHFQDMYAAGFYPYDSPEEYWGYWSRYININRYLQEPSDVYHNLLKLVASKDYFVLTTNVDHCFQRANFDKDKLFYTQGDYGLWQCSIPCHTKTYDNQEIVQKMVQTQCDRRISSDLIPYCPVCGEPMSMNLRADNTFVEGDGWHQAAERYQEFIQKQRHSNILYFELGVGNNTPGIIKYPFWQMTYQNPNASYCSINMTDVSIVPEIKKQSIGITCDIGAVLNYL